MRLCGSGASVALPVLSPMSSACGCSSGSARGGDGPTLSRGRAGSGAPDVEQTIDYTRNMRAVKATYWGLVFLCSCLVVFGVGRCLRCPSGRLCGLRGVIWDGRGYLGHCPPLCVTVQAGRSTVYLIRREPATVHHPSPGHAKPWSMVIRDIVLS